MVNGNAYTVTMNNLVTLAGSQVPSGTQVAFTYEPTGTGSALREYWPNIGGTAVTDLTGNANYPNNPSGTSLRHHLRGAHRFRRQLRHADPRLHPSADDRQLHVLDRQRRHQRVVALDRRRSGPQGADRLGARLDGIAAMVRSYVRSNRCRSSWRPGASTTSKPCRRKAAAATTWPCAGSCPAARSKSRSPAAGCPSTRRRPPCRPTSVPRW